MRLLTGGSLTLSWSKPIKGDNQSTTLVLSQPLLKGFGVRLERDAVERVHLQEEINRRAFRDAAAGMVHSVIGAWRNLQSATASLEIARDSLKRAERQLAGATALIEAGELAPQERVHAEATRVNRVYQVTDAERAHRNAMGHLLDVVELEQAEDDLIEAQEREIESRIAYQDAVTSLDATLGTTLDRWGIAIESVGR